MTIADLSPPVLARQILYDASILLGHSSRWHRPDKKREKGFARNEHGTPVWATDAFAVAWDCRGALWRAGFEKGWIWRQNLEAPVPQIVSIAELWLARGIDRFWRPPFLAKHFFRERARYGEDEAMREEITADRWIPAGGLITTFEDYEGAPGFPGTTHADVTRAFAHGLNAADRALAELSGDPLPALLPLNHGAKAA